MFFRRSPRRRGSAIGSSVENSRSRWPHSNTERVFGLKRGYARRLSMETLEDRRLLTTNVYFDNVTNQMAIVDDYFENSQQGGEPEFTDADHVQEDNDVTLSLGAAGRLRITDPLGVILEPGIILTGSGAQISPTVVEIDSSATVRVDLQGGNDRLTMASNFNLVAVLSFVEVHGGDSGHTDSLTLSSSLGVAETVTINPDSNVAANQFIGNYASKSLIVSGFEDTYYQGNGGDDNLIVDLGFGEATARVQNSSPLNTDEVVSSTLPRILFNGLNNFTLQGDPGEATTATFVIDSLAGATTHTFNSQDDDTLVIEGNGGGNDFTVTRFGVGLRITSGGETVDATGMTSTDLLKIVGLGGDDSLVVDVNAVSLIPTPIEFDGGSGSDRLTVQGASVSAIAAVYYTPGLQPDEGRLEYVSDLDLRLMSIDFDNLEPVVDLVVAPALVVNGTPEANAINYRVGSVVTRGLVTVDNYESIEFSNKTSLTINALAGSDEINLNNPNTPTALTSINVHGNDPTASDVLTVNGVAATTLITLNTSTITGASGAAGAVPIVYSGIEHINAVAGASTTLSLANTDATNGINYTFVPGVAIDEGLIQPNTPGTTIPISFKGYGPAQTINFQGDDAGGNDTLTVEGTALSDVITVAATTGAVTIAGRAQITRGTGLEDLVIEGLDGDDTFNVNSSQVWTFITINGGDPSASDILNLNGAAAAFENVTVAPNGDPTKQVITGLGSTITSSGVELIKYNAIQAGGEDNFNVNLGTGTATARVQGAATNTDEVISNRLPRIQFTGVADFFLQGSTQPTTATFVPDNLTGANGGAAGLFAYNFNSNSANDTLVIEGDGGGLTAADAITVSLSLSGQLQVQANGKTINTSGMTSTDLFQANTLGGNDILNVVVTPGRLISTPIFYDGGSGADSLAVSGSIDNGAGDTSSVIYTPGLQVDEGRLLYSESNPPVLEPAATTTMDITFDNMEPVVETVIADSLTVNGNGSANAMTVVQDPNAATRALVTVDGFETMSFNNKTALVLNSLAGDDIVNINIAAAALITALATVTVNANDGNDTVRFQNLPTTAGFTGATVNAGAGNDTIEAFNIPTTTLKPLTLNGEEGNDTITGGPNGDTISGGAGDDTLIDSPGADIYNGNGGIDTLVIRGTAINDILSFVQNAPVGGAGTNYTVNIINGPLAAPPAATVDQITTTTGAAPSDPANRPTVERILIEALAGDDAITVAHNDAYSDFVGTPPVENLANGRQLQTIPVHVVGDSPNASDRLVVQDNGVGDLVIHREGPDGRSGSIVVGGMAPVSYESTERVDIIPLDNAGQTGTPPAGGRLLVFKYDDLETNESATNASPLGLEPTFIGQRNIDPGAVNLPPFGQIPGDEDWYEFKPQIASTFRFDIFFEHIETLPSGRPGLPEDGDLRLDVFRADGTLIGSSDSSVITTINVDSSESVTVALNPAITESVFIRVKGSFLANPDPDAEAPSTSINIYDILATDVDDDGPVVFDPDNGGDLQAIFPNNLTTFNLFDPKPTVLAVGSTPLIFSLTVNLRDLPFPAAPGDPLPALDTQSASQPGVYRVVGDHVGIVDILSVQVLNNFQANGDVDAAPAPTNLTFRDAGLVGLNLEPINGQPALVGSFIQFTSGANSGQIRTIAAFNPANGDITLNAVLPFVLAAGDDFTITSTQNAQVRINFAKPLLDDRYTLTILDSITDPAGNRLDGESDAPEPGTPTFPSGNGVPGGDFQARFTVDTRPEVGAALAGDIDVDINGNYVWDPANGQIGNDHTNVDLEFTMTVQNGVNGPITSGGQNVNDLTFAGRFTNNGTTPFRRFDMLGAYGYAADTAPPNQRWIIDLNGDGIVTLGSDIFTTQPSLGATFNVSGAIPIAGNFSDAFAGDEVGLYNAGKWGLDKNHNFIIEAGEVFTGTITGVPIVGDFDGDGDDDLGTFNNNTFFFDFATSTGNGFGGQDASFIWGFPGVLDRPIAADIDQDGIDDVGLWVPRDSSTLPQEVAEWFFLMSDSAMAPVTDDPNIVADNATTTTFFATNLINSTAQIQGKLIRFLSGQNAGQVRTVTNFVAGTGQITLNGSPLPFVPAAGDTFSIGGTSNTIETINHAFSPVPFGNDIYAEFGDELALPLIGNFDPPVTATLIAPNTGITGDYDNTGVVNDGDYYSWRANFGSTTNSLPDGNHDSTVNAADFVLWRNNAPGHQGAGGGGGETSSANSSAGESVAAEESSSPAASDLSVVAFDVAAPSASSETLVAAASESSQAPAASAAAVDSVFSSLSSEGDDSSSALAESTATATAFDDNLLLAARSTRLDRDDSDSDSVWSSDEAADDEIADSALAEFDEVFAMAW